MAVLEKITQMKNQGMSTGQIVNSLKSEGVSPKEINEALSQSEIKSEIANPPLDANPAQSQQALPSIANPTDNPNQQPIQDQPQNPPLNQTQQILQTQQSQPINQSQPPAQLPPNYSNPITTPEQSQQMNPSIMPQGELTGQDQYQAQPLEAPQPQDDLQMQAQYQDFQQDPYDTNTYPEYSPPQSTDFEAINDITNQLIDEKIQNLKKDLSISLKSKERNTEKLMEIETRLEKVENILNELQMSLIRKIGDYGENVENISQELKATQDAFAKMVDPLTDQKRKTKTSTKKGKKEKKEKAKTSFEDYLR